MNRCRVLDEKKKRKRERERQRDDLGRRNTDREIVKSKTNKREKRACAPN